MGFGEIFEIRRDLPFTPRAECEELVTGDLPSHGELLRTMLDAHRTLVSLNDGDRQRFQDVVTHAGSRNAQPVRARPVLR